VLIVNESVGHETRIVDLTGAGRRNAADVAPPARHACSRTGPAARCTSRTSPAERRAARWHPADTMPLLGVIKGPLTFLRSERPARDRLSPLRDGSLDVQAHRGPGCRSGTPSARASPGGASRSSGVDSRTEERPRLSRPESRPLRMSSTFSTPTWPLAASPLQVRPADHHGASTERDGLDHVAAHPEPPSSTISTSPPTASAMAGSVRTDAGAAVLGRLRERVQLTRGQRQAVPILARPRQGAKLIPGRVRWRAARPGMADRTLRRRRSRRNLNGTFRC
jgi:hypothetical protein